MDPTGVDARTVFQAVGGAETFDRVVDRFYEGVSADPGLRPMYPEDLAASRRHLSLFLQQYFGGPGTYSEVRGHPRLRSRHFVAEIGPVERDEWLLCFRRALDETISSQALRDLIWAPVERLAYHMQNKATDNKEQS